MRITFGLERLLELCKTARMLLDERGIRIGRVIARPFLGDIAADFKRTGNRHDYSLMPGETVLNRLQAAGVTTIGVGKISDIFADSGISRILSDEIECRRNGGDSNGFGRRHARHRI